MSWLLKRLPTNPTTITGRMVGIAAVTSLLAVVDASLIPLLSQLIWIVIIAFLCGLLFRPKLQFAISDSLLLVNGQTSSIEVKVENVGNFTAYDIQISFPFSGHGLRLDKHPKAIGELAARSQIALSFEVKATERGEHRLPAVLAASLFPFGMFRFISQRKIESTVLVAPSYTVDACEMSFGNTVESNFVDLNSRRQRALEYVGSCEYRDGMAVRRWDFAAWARLGVPTIREFHELDEPTAMIVVDGLHTGRGSTDANLESVLSKAASAAVALDRNGFRLILVNVCETVEILEGQRECGQVDLLLRSLARLVGNQIQPDWPEVWKTIERTVEIDWDLFCFLRSDHPRKSILSNDELPLVSATVDWTPDVALCADSRKGL